MVRLLNSFHHLNVFYSPFVLDVSDISKSLAEDSKKYRWGAKKLSVMVLPLLMAKGGS
jgi:hypothetical protein